MTKVLKLSLSASFLVLALTSAKVVLQNNGIAGYTNSPGEQNCSACHNSFALNSGGGSISISTTPTIGASGYTPGTTYTIDVTIAKTGVALFGFGCEILDAANSNAGTISVLNATQTKLLNSGGRRNIVHQINGGTGTGSKTFSFQWLAPSVAAPATIYVAGIAANGNNQSSSDYVYTTSLSLSAPVGVPSQENVVSALNIYPNPAHERVTLSYSLKEDAVVACSLNLPGGELLHHFPDKKETAGNCEQVLILPANLSPGFYILKLSANGYLISRRLIVH